jgi:hypothetical protein
MSALHVLDPLDAIHLAFAFEIVPQNEGGGTVQPENTVTDGIQGILAQTDAPAEIFDPNQRRLFILYINPEKYDWSRPGAVQATPAQGLVFADDTGFATQILQITGRFGAKRRVSHNRFGSQDVLSGHEQFLEFKGFLEGYQTLRKNGAAVELHFHAFRYEDHFVVLPLKFDMAKSKKTRIGSPEYVFQLQATRQLSAAEIPVSLFDVGFFGAVADVVNTATQAIDGATIAIAQIRAAASLPRRVVAQVDPFLDSVELLISETQGLNSEIEAIRTLGASQMRRIRALGERAVQAVEDFAHGVGGIFEDIFETAEDAWDDVFGGDEDETSQAYRDLSTIEQAVNDLETVANSVSSRGARAERWGRQVVLDYNVSNDDASDLADAISPDGDDVDGAGFESAIARRLRAGALGGPRASDLEIQSILRRMASYRGWVPYILSAGETPYSVSSSQYRTPDRWIDIILANDFEPPYFGAGANTAQPGDIIRLPVLGRGPSVPFDFSVEDLPELGYEIERRIYGVDYALIDNDGLLDFEVDPGSGYLDWKLVEGFPCFIQRLEKILLRIERGASVLFPNTGVVYRIGEQNLPDSNVLMILSLREALLNESAVRRIKNERVVREGTGVFVEYDLDTFASGPVKIRRAL